MSSQPYGPTAGFSASQALTVTDSQESQYSARLESTTTFFHRADADMEDVFDYESFIDDSTLSSQAQSSVHLSQDPAGLSPLGSVSDARLIRLPPGSYRERATSAETESLINYNEDEFTGFTPAEAARHVDAAYGNDEDIAEYEENGRSAPNENTRSTPTPSSSRPSAQSARVAAPLGVAESAHAPTEGRAAAIPQHAQAATTDASHSDEEDTVNGEMPSAPTGAAQSGTDTDSTTSSQAAPQTPTKDGHFLAGETLHRIRRQGHPHLSWDAVQTASEASNVPPTGTIEGVVPAYVNFNITHHAFAVQAAAMDAVQDKVKNCTGSKEFEVSLQSGRFKCVRISFATAELLTTALGLRIEVPSIDGHPPFVIDNFSVGTPLGARYVALQVRHPGLSPHAAKKKLETAIRDAEGVYLVEVWAVYHHSGPAPAPRTPTNTLVALLFVKPPLGGTFASPLTHEELRAICCYIAQFPTVFGGRFPLCRGCKGPAQAREDFHITSACVNPAVPCALCNKWGHTGARCPQNAAFTSHTHPGDDDDAPHGVSWPH